METTFVVFLGAFSVVILVGTVGVLVIAYRGAQMTPIFDKCLCQDCLSIRWLPRLVENEAAIDQAMEACDCGGEVCWCNGCVADAEALESGERGMVGSCLIPITHWNPITGIRP